MEWSYGVTTCVIDGEPRKYLGRSLQSLARAGFDQPRIFCDGWCDTLRHQIGEYNITVRNPPAKTYANWMLTALELYLANPNAARYAIFQDDVIYVRGLRAYLENMNYPDCAYLNLYACPRNEHPAKRGWFPTQQTGQGALALVFDHAAMLTILSSRLMLERPIKRGTRRHKGVDGAIVTAMNMANHREYVHNPSLCQHIGDETSMENSSKDKSKTFPGEDFNISTMTSEVSKDYCLRDLAKTLRIGLVGFNDQTRVGDICRTIVHKIPVEKWLIRTNQLHQDDQREQFPTDMVFCQSGNTDKIEKFVKSVDVVVMVEGPTFGDLIQLCETHRKRVVCVPTLPPSSVGHPWEEAVDMFVCTDDAMYHAFTLAKRVTSYFPWPAEDQWRYRADELHKLVATGEHVMVVPQPTQEACHVQAER